MEERSAVGLCLAEEPYSAEVQVLLFSAALKSFKRDFLLKPFPAWALRDGRKDFAHLDVLVRDLPRLVGINPDQLTDEQIQLLHFILFHQDFQLTVVSDAAEKARILGLAGEMDGKAPLPDLIFSYRGTERREAAFAETAAPFPTRFAYHGSKLDHFHSILHHGLISHLNKTSMYGSGTYLSPELSLSLNWAPMAAPGPRHSALGRRFSAVALCQLAEDPSGLRLPHTAATTTADLPDRYILAKNDALVALRYVLVYADRGGARSGSGGLGAMLRRHWAVLGILLYLGLLAVAWGVGAGSGLLRRFSYALMGPEPGLAPPPLDDPS